MASLLIRILEHDERLLHAVVLRRTSLTDTVMRSATHLGDARVTISIALLYLWIFPGMGGIGRQAAFTLVVSHIWVQLLKRSISRPRPSLPVGCVSLIDAPDHFSFPSGHAASSLSLTLPAIVLLPLPLGLAAAALAGMVGWSRCYLGVHYPGDVLMGWILAILAALVAQPALGSVLL